MNLDEFSEPFVVLPGKKIRLAKDFDPRYRDPNLEKDEAAERLAHGIAELAKEQTRLYVQSEYAVLLVLQAMDAAGKDSVIKHVMTGINPQGCHVVSFKAPSHEELAHDYLWRCVKALPERGRIGIFNRSYYEEVLIARVHPELLAVQNLPESLRNHGIWERRFREINDFERHLVDNGTVVVKVFLHVSKDEQRKRFIERLERPEKQWKFSIDDVHERKFWDEYQVAYEDMLNHTSTEHAPWYVVPADRKWYTRHAVSGILYHIMRGLDLSHPTLSAEQLAELTEARALLDREARE
jgi:PPK2 family polyphosphate:nucleotide phosphotransferase